MSQPDPKKPTQPKLADVLPNDATSEELKASYRKAKEAAAASLDSVTTPEVDKALQTSKSFYQENKNVILATGVVLLTLRVNKRMVKKATVKAVAKALKKAEFGGVDLPNLYDILNELRNTPGMAYIPHGGGMVHLLKGKDAIVTVFGDFEKMSNDDIWNSVANILNLGVRTTN